MQTSFSVEIRELPLRDPFGISRCTRRSVRNLFVRIDEGWGEGAPIYYQGQTVERMQELALEWLSDTPDFNRPLTDLLEDLLERYPKETALWQAIDLALHDRWGKQSSQSLHRLWNIPWSTGRISSFTIGMDDMDTVLCKVDRAAEYPILKVKVGGERDLEVLRAIYQRTGKSLYVDANEAWSIEQTVEYLPILRDCGVQLIEQPLARTDLMGYRHLRKVNTTGIPILIDEGVHGPEDIAAWVGLADGINIKLAKCGGLARARRMVEIARQNGLKIMLGCMIESSLGITAAAQIAPLVDFLDLDGAALLANDPCEGMALRNGELVLPDGLGIGIRWKSA